MRLVHVIELHNVDTCNEPLPEKVKTLPFFLVSFAIYSLLPSHTKLCKQRPREIMEFKQRGEKPIQWFHFKIKGKKQRFARRFTLEALPLLGFPPSRRKPEFSKSQQWSRTNKLQEAPFAFVAARS